MVGGGGGQTERESGGKDGRRENRGRELGLPRVRELGCTEKKIRCAINRRGGSDSRRGKN